MLIINHIIMLLTLPLFLHNEVLKTGIKFLYKR